MISSSIFCLFWQLGFEHITDLAGYDHILFLLSLCIAYRFAHWRRLLVLVSAFTLGHCITLALAAMQIVSLPEKLIEVAIAATIATSALLSLFNTNRNYSQRRIYIHYGVILVFGLVHGLGFSNYLRSILANDSSLIFPLLSFNIGLECGQICIVLLLVGINEGIFKILKNNQKYWNNTLACLLFLWAIRLIIERIVA